MAIFCMREIHSNFLYVISFVWEKMYGNFLYVFFCMAIFCMYFLYVFFVCIFLYVFFCRKTLTFFVCKKNAIACVRSQVFYVYTTL